MAYYRRRKLEWWEEAAAVAAGAAAGVATGYLARLWLRRQPAGARPPPAPDGGEDTVAGRGEPPGPAGERRADTAGSDPRR